MTDNSMTNEQDRRMSPRVAGRGGANIVVLDLQGLPLARGAGLQVLDVSDGGIGLATELSCCVGAHLHVIPEMAPKSTLDVEVVTKSLLADGRMRLGCRLARGAMPAELSAAA